MYKVEFERTLFGNLYKEYKRKDLPVSFKGWNANIKSEISRLKKINNV